MKVYSNIVFPDLTRQLVIAGFLPVYAQDAAITHPAPDWLSIFQFGGFVENSVFDLDCGSGMGCILTLHVAVDLPAFSILRWELDLPYKDPKFQWLPEPQGDKFPNNVYLFPGCHSLDFQPKAVINHRRGLKRSHDFQGLLLGYSFESIPDSYPHGKIIDARLVLVNDMERSYSTPVQLWVNRSAKFDRQRGKEKIRRSILDQLVDNGEEVLKDDEEVLVKA